MDHSLRPLNNHYDCNNFSKKNFRQTVSIYKKKMIHNILPKKILGDSLTKYVVFPNIVINI